MIGLPDELLECILGHLDVPDKRRLSATCKEFWDASVLWFPGLVMKLDTWTDHPPQLLAWLGRVQAQVHVRCRRGHELRLLDLAPTVYKRITELELGDCLDSKVEVPSQVAAMTALQWVKLFGIITKGLHHLADLPHLHTLRAPFCSFPNNKLPADLARLTRLRTLDLLFSGLTSHGCWEHLLPLQQLECLTLTTTGVSGYGIMPEQLSGMSQLTKLTIENTRPIGTYMPTQLKSLSMHNCRVTRIPERLSLMADLWSLKVSSNAITGGWQHLPRQLQRLNIENCQLNQLPADLSALTQLACLYVTYNHIQGGWQHLLPLRQLQQLDLGYCDLTHVPSELSSMSQLTHVDLWGNPIRGGLQHLPEQLLRLGLSLCDLQRVPTGLSRFTRLARLDLSDNPMLAHLSCVHDTPQSLALLAL